MCYARRQRSSWARIKLSNEWYLKSSRTLNLPSSYDLLFYFCLSSILFQNFRVPFAHTFMLVLSSLLFNFQWPFCSPTRAVSLTIISLPIGLVKGFFEKSFSFFHLFPLALDRFWTALLLYYFHTPLSRGFFSFFTFCPFRPISIHEKPMHSCDFARTPPHGSAPCISLPPYYI